jgi:hypothetical protein
MMIFRTCLSIFTQSGSRASLIGGGAGIPYKCLGAFTG